MSSPEFSIVKPTTHEDISFAIEHGHRCYYGKLGDEKIAYVQVVPYGDEEEYCYGGMYIVKEEYRHRGYGKQIFDVAWSAIPDSSLVGLSAVAPKDLVYMKYGFKTSWSESWYLFDAKKIVGLLDSNEKDVTTVRYKDADFQSLLQYDTNAFCYSREVYLRMVGEVSHSEGWVAINQDNEIVGYVVARCALDMSEWLLFPLIADNLSIAKVLLMELSKFLMDQPAKSFTMVIPDINTCAITFAEQSGAMKTSETIRMFAKGDPPDKMIKNHAEIIFSTNPNIG